MNGIFARGPFKIIPVLHDFFSDEPDNRFAEKDDKFDFKDNSEEFTTYHEKTKTTHTEKITTKRRTEKKKIDLGAAASQLGRDQGDNQVSWNRAHY